MCERTFSSKEALYMHSQSKHPGKAKKLFFTSKQKKSVRNYAVLVVVILLAGGFAYWRAVPPKDAPLIEVSPPSYNFGTVSQAAGEASGTLTLANKGNEALILKGMDTSCGCTSAAVVSDGVEGPRFSMAMHGTNPKNWKQVILPGESVQLKIYYDPNVHKSLRGAVTRSVYIFSNDPRNSKKEIRITAFQTS